jgi:23S rRNA pseudouridine1911/1915/1917 synthase
MIPRVPGEPPRDLSRPLEEMRILVDARQDGDRLDLTLASRLTWRSRTSIHRLIRDGFVILQGRAAKPAARVRAGEIIAVRIPKRPLAIVKDPPRESDIRVLYEDEWMLAVDKPPGLAVHPAGRRVTGTLIHWFHARYRRPEDPDHDVVPRLLHRIDRETSGVVAASLDEGFHADVGAQFEERTVRKTYLAVVHGAPPQDEGIIDFGIGPDRRSVVHLKMEARRDGSGQPALTRYRVRRRNRSFALVELTPRTGRTHQIRVHLAALGCPLVGDKIYGPDESIFLEDLAGQISDESMGKLILGRHALHAHRLVFEHPRLRRELVLEAPLPRDMAELVE